MKRQTRKMLSPVMGTAHSLEKWHKAMFENLGWMVLAKEKGLDYKIATYKKAIDRLIASIKHVSSEYESRNRKHDLNVILLNVMCLKSFVDKHL